jgi:hypothetical protein
MKKAFAATWLHSRQPLRALPEPPVSSALTARQFGQPTASLVRLGVAVTTGMRIGNAG